MKTRLFGLMLLVLLISLFSATAAFADDGDDGNYEFKGTIVSLPATPGWIGDWVVSDVATDRAVHVDASTRIEEKHGPVAVNACVEVKGWLQGDGSVDATKIETQKPSECPGGGGGGGGYTEFYGIVESFPLGWIGDWVVSATTVHVDTFTRIEEDHGPVAVGVCVEVKGLLQGDGSVNATKIETKEPSRCSGVGGGSPYVEFYGTIESLPSTSGWIGDWTVSGRTVRVTTSTRIEQEHGAVAIGAYVEVKGAQQADGSIDATKVEVKMSPGDGGGGGSYTKFYGTVDSLPASGWLGTWVVSGTTVHVDATTRIEQEEGPIAVGAYVEVKGWSQADGSVNATKIEVKTSPGGGGGGSTKFYGTVESLPTAGLLGDWVVSGLTVHVDVTTRIEQEDGLVAVGAYVKVKGWGQADGSVNATEIEVKASPDGGSSTKFYGTVEQLPTGGLIGTWIVSGRTVVVDAATRIDQEHGTVAVGAYVEVKGLLQADGSVNATKIEVKSAAAGGSGSYVKFYGIVEDLPTSGLVGDWLVSGRTVHVSATTRIEEDHGLVRIGAYVEVKGIQQADGSVDAAKIEVKG